jgi:hypothetical protein
VIFDFSVTEDGEVSCGGKGRRSCRTNMKSKQEPSANGDFMTLTKKSDVHRHTSTKSREDRKIDRSYGAKPVPLKGKPVAVPAEVKAAEMPAKPAK